MSGAAPGWPGATREHTRSMRPSNNTGRSDATPAECDRIHDRGH